MATIPKKTEERYKKAVPKFQKILKTALDRDVNEADTVAIIQDMLADVFGFEKYVEITGEYAIRGTFCDLAVKIGDKVQHLIEVKAIGLTLKDAHLKQAIDYGANKGVKWVVLTNGITWQMHCIKFEKPLSHELVLEFDFLDLNTRKAEDREKLFLLSRRGIGKAGREAYYERVQNVNRFVVAAVILSDSILKAIRRDVRKVSPGIIVDVKEIERLLRKEVLKRDTIEGDEASKTTKHVGKLLAKSAKNVTSKTKAKETTEVSSESVDGSESGQEG